MADIISNKHLLRILAMTDKYILIEAAALEVQQSEGCTLLEAITALQAAAAQTENEKLLDLLCEYKNKIIEKFVKDSEALADI